MSSTVVVPALTKEMIDAALREIRAEHSMRNGADAKFPKFFVSVTK